jgi:hypothetical protein
MSRWQPSAVTNSAPASDASVALRLVESPDIFHNNFVISEFALD